MKKSDLQKPSTKQDIEEAVAQIVGAVNKVLENKADKDDIKILDTKVDQISSNVSDIKRRLTDLEQDTPTETEFQALKKHVGFRYKPD